MILNNIQHKEIQSISEIEKASAPDNINKYTLKTCANEPSDRLSKFLTHLFFTDKISKRKTEKKQSYSHFAFRIVGTVTEK